ncbi:uncharacterized protein/domain associated with GTPase-like protein [Limnospira platensis NIES-39]|uniref:SHOCT domain-containing protein n=2 Tax=Sirenicapillariaceae TaxID=2934961 RepID=A0A5M3T4H6_LIMPL|nr:uncharacterized protein/domain associated with GTPase-like protein [Arthrospira platensis NIES-39]GCE93767.1 hypothetical protein NIES46_18190 [Arthrospira platensis NIES-46]
MATFPEAPPQIIIVYQVLLMSKKTEADAIIRNHVLWSMGGGLIPIPIVDFMAVTAIQMEMLQELAKLYGVNYSVSTGKAFVSALTGTTIARLGSSFIKAIPGIGSLIGGTSMALTSGASTYAVGQVAINHFSSGGSLNNFAEEEVKWAYESAFERGKNYVSDLEKDKADEAANIYQTLEKLGQLKQQGVLSEEEFQAKKQELLSRI